MYWLVSVAKLTESGATLVGAAVVCAPIKRSCRIELSGSLDSLSEFHFRGHFVFQSATFDGRPAGRRKKESQEYARFARRDCLATQMFVYILARC